MKTWHCSLDRFLVSCALPLTMLSALQLTSLAQAEEAPAYRETQLGLYVTATEAYKMIQQDDETLLIDVRDPIEIKFTGFADPTDIHVPWVLADRSRFDADAQTWPIQRNTDFEAQVSSALNAQGAQQDTPIIVMCRSGATRSAPAADAIADMGFSRVYSVSDGFEGGKLSEGDSAGVRARNGWRNSDLPWGYSVSPEIAWHADP